MTLLYISADSELFREWAAHEAYAETRRRVFIQTDAIRELCEHLHQHGESAMEEEDIPQPEYLAYRKEKVWVVFLFCFIFLFFVFVFLFFLFFTSKILKFIN